jgi:uncharacterized membrane protein
MFDHAGEWANLLLRWAHLVAGIAWIGSSFYFIWLDASLEKPPPDRKDKVEGHLWMVHSGGFYVVERRFIGPGEIPPNLHWFKWEATFTWITGFFLLGVVYYLSGGAYLIDPAVAALTPGQAVALSVCMLIGGWLVYDHIWNQLGIDHPRVATALSLAFVTALAYFLFHLFSGRAAYIHLGAIFGTCMVLNVWVHILPSQQQMIDATKRGEKPDYTLSMHAKRRSVHNSYMTFPVLFTMLSNHFPMTYGSPDGWVALLLLVVLGGAARHVMIGKTRRGRRIALVPTAAALAGVVLLCAPREAATSASAETATTAAAGPPVSFLEARTIVALRCMSCHSAYQADASFGPAPGGVSFDDPASMATLAPRIQLRVIESKTMPMLNKTGMTEAERAILARWIAQGARVDAGR